MIRKIRYKRLVIFLVLFIVLILIIVGIFNKRITNIYINGNYYVSDQEIIEYGHLEKYPRMITTFSKSVETSISKNPYIESVQVRKNLGKIYIDVVENRPLVYDEKSKRIILKNGEYSSDVFSVPVLTSSISEEIYNQFLKKLSLIELSVFNSISEIEYAPNGVDNKLFIFTMNDGNYVYINLDKFENINKYFDMVIKFNNHKGILYLDSGEYFKIFDN